MEQAVVSVTAVSDGGGVMPPARPAAAVSGDEPLHVVELTAQERAFLIRMLDTSRQRLHQVADRAGAMPLAQRINLNLAVNMVSAIKQKAVES